MAFTQYRKKTGEVVELELTDDGGAVIRNPKDHNDTRKISREDLRENYEVLGENQEEKDKREFDERMKAAVKDMPKDDPFLGRAKAAEDAAKAEPKPTIHTPDEGFPKKNPERVTK